MHLDSIMTIKGKNLFDIDDTVWGENIDENGVEASSNFSSHSDYIECKPNTTYTVSWIANNAGVVTRYHEYDNNKTWLRQITTHNAPSVGEKSVTFTTGATARYIRFTFRGKSASSSDLSTNIQLEEGSTATPYSPHAGEFKTIGSGDNKIWERAIQNDTTKGALTTMQPTRVVRNLFDVKQIAEGKSLDASGQMVNNVNYAVSGKIYLPSGRYTFSQKRNIDGTADALGVWCYNNNDGAISRLVNVSGAACASQTFTMPSNAVYIRIAYRYITSTEMMLNEGSTAQSYYPYFSPQTVLPSAKVFGKTERTIVIEGKRYVVPSDIELVEYIESTGTQWINTGFTPDNNTRVICKYKCTDISTTNNLFGARASTTAGAFTYGTNVDGLRRVGWGNATTGYIAEDTNWHTVDMDGKNRIVKVDGATLTTLSTNTFTSPTTMGILAIRATTSTTVYFSEAQVASAIIYDNGTLVHAMYPAIKNSVVGMYDFITGQFFTNAGTGTFTAGKKTKTVRTKNLFDSTKTTYHMYYTATGVWQTASSVSSSDFIEVKPNTTYVLSGTSMSSGITRRVNLLDADKNWISQPKAGNYPLVVTTTAETKYIRFSYGDSSGLVDTNIQLEEASTATEYIPYTIEVPLFELYGVGDRTKNLVDISAVTDGYYYSTTGVYTPAEVARLTDYIACEPSNSYTLSTKVIGATVAANIRVNYFNSNKEWIKQDYQSFSIGDVEYTVTTPANAKYIRFSANYAGATLVDWNIMMLVKGSTEPTEYIPYGYQVDTLLGSQGCIDLGTLNWNKHTTQTGIWNAILSGKAYGITNMFTTSYEISDVSAISEQPNNTIKGHRTNANIYIRDDDKYNNMTVAEFKAAMSGVMLYYQRTDDAMWQPPTPYTFYTDRQLNAVSTYEDVLISNNDGTGSIAENVGVKVFDGTENWAYASVAQAYYVDGLVQALEKTHTCYCTHFVGIPTNQSSTSGSNEIKVGSNTSSSLLWNRIYAYASLTDHPTVADFKAYLAQQYANGTPVTVYYPTSSPTTTQLTGLPVISLTEKAQYTLENTNTVKGDMQATALSA